MSYLAKTIEKESGEQAEPEGNEQDAVHWLGRESAHPQDEPDWVGQRVNEGRGGDRLVLALEFELVGLSRQRETAEEDRNDVRDRERDRQRRWPAVGIREEVVGLLDTYPESTEQPDH